MVSKGDLGVSYLIAVGVGLFGALSSGLLVPFAGGRLLLDPNSLLALFSGFIVATGFTASGVGLMKSEFTDERVWRVAKWGTAGLGLPVMLVVGIAVFRYHALAGLGWQSVAMINIAGGGVVGILIGTIIELRAEHAQTKTLNQRNTVFLRLFRHDIRTSANLVLGYVNELVDDTPDSAESAGIVREQIDHIMRLSETARHLDALGADEGARPMNLSLILEESISDLRADFPDAEIHTDIAPEAFVRANDTLEPVVDNLLRNAVEHNDGDPRVTVSLRQAGPSDRFVELEIRDNGPGFPEHELDVHATDIETDLKHSDGVGLWLARWVVDTYDGEITLENNPDRGAVVTVDLPPADLEQSWYALREADPGAFERLFS